MPDPRYPLEESMTPPPTPEYDDAEVRAVIEAMDLPSTRFGTTLPRLWEGAGEFVGEHAGRVAEGARLTAGDPYAAGQAALAVTSVVDPTMASDVASAALYKLEGDDEAAAIAIAAGLGGLGAGALAAKLWKMRQAHKAAMKARGLSEEAAESAAAETAARAEAMLGMSPTERASERASAEMVAIQDRLFNELKEIETAEALARRGGVPSGAKSTEEVRSELLDVLHGQDLTPLQLESGRMSIGRAGDAELRDKLSRFRRAGRKPDLDPEEEFFQESWRDHFATEDEWLDHLGMETPGAARRGGPREYGPLYESEAERESIQRLLDPHGTGSFAEKAYPRGGAGRPPVRGSTIDPVTGTDFAGPAWGPGSPRRELFEEVSRSDLTPGQRDAARRKLWDLTDDEADVALREWKDLNERQIAIDPEFTGDTERYALGMETPEEELLGRAMTKPAPEGQKYSYEQGLNPEDVYPSTFLDEAFPIKGRVSLGSVPKTNAEARLRVGLSDYLSDDPFSNRKLITALKNDDWAAVDDVLRDVETPQWAIDDLRNVRAAGTGAHMRELSTDEADELIRRVERLLDRRGIEY
jgi:hypothetical protein